MADNTTLNAGSGGDVIASDDIAGVKYQRVKLSVGADGSAADAASGGGVEAGSLRVTIASDSTGVLSVDDNGGSLTVDGTVTANLAAGTNNIGDVDVLSVVPGTGATALGKAIDTAAGATDTGVALLAVRDDALTTLTPVDGDYVPLRTDSTGALHVRVSAGGVAGVVEDAASAGGEEGILMLAVRRDTAASSSGTDGDFSTLNTDSTGKLHVNVGNTVTVASHAVTNAGTFAVQVDGAALTALQLIDNPVVVDDAAFTPATTSVMVAGFQADETATDSVDEGDAGAARMTLDRKQIVTLAPHTQGGPTIFRSLDIDESEEEIKATAGQVYWIHAMNMVATARYLKFYNATAASVTVGSTTPVLTFPIPANSTTGAGFVFNIPQGIPFSTAISVACTTGVADADTGAPGANDVIINVGYL